ncbi:endonuclease/exonuclease/phosphatase family protein [Prolixibacteraceae bacterium Z1-6]|uniref:Endonuclease/exonuclease/phosphatase family protein n=1 Tax=Draconibacterium aestuarii TaxID=2998507 RepID=A0A9X3FC40_9BACT|nr:endonuclease/exonuclease/phosphatase family protein [Prolixibacteraceae bacterium Z1-6]
MKKLILIVLLMIPTALFAQQMNIISFNIRYNNTGDGINAWPNRIEMVNGLLKFHEPDIFGLQEALLGQILDIENGLPGYEWFGVGREDGDKAGEFSPIFFNKTKLLLIENGHFWLSENCDKPELGWDAACKRIVTWGKFQSKVTGKQFFVFNTHFDHVGDEARKNSAFLIRDKMNESTKDNGLPVILTGDFNLTPETKPIELIKGYMSDSREISEELPYGPIGTFNAFKWDAPYEKRIDYIFVNDRVKVLKYAALTDNKEQRWPSDHIPVFVKVQLK